MKRITQNLRWLVTLLTMIVSVGAWAQEVTYDFTGTGWSVSNGTLSNGTVSFTGEGGANFKMNGGYFMMGKSGAYINFPTYDFAVEKIEVVGRSGASTGVKQNIFVGDDAVSTETEGATSTNTYEIASAYQAAGTQYTLKVTSSHNTQITAIKIYKASSIAAPTFSPAGGVYSGSQTVTISCETQGVSIYYTTDGSDPDALANPYSAPITISETTTLKAVAYDGDNYSNVTSATYTIATPITIADARAQVTGDVFTSGIVTSCVGTTAYIEDGNAAICVYGASLTVGDDVNVQGTLTTYHGLLEITNPTVTVLSSGPNVTPATKTIDEINDDYAGDNALQGRLVRIENATVTAISGKNTTIAQGENTIVVRDITGVTLAVNDVVSLTGNIGCYDAAQIVNPTDVEVSEAPATPSITLSTSAINVSAEGGNGTIKVSYQAFEPESFDIEFCEADGTPLEDGPDWITALCEYPEEGDVVNYSIDPNDGEARTAYFKVFCYIDQDTDPVYSELITITQAEYVAPSIATLPFEFNSGRANIEETEGLTQEGLGSDYSGNVPKLKFDGTGDWVLLQFDEVPGNLSFDIKGNSFSGGTFTVQTSTNGTTFTELKTYTELGSNTLSETFDNLSSDVRYIKWIYTNKSSGNVGLGNIILAKYEEPEPSIIVNSTTIDIPAEGGDGTIEVTYTRIAEKDIVFYESDGTTSATYDWIDADINADGDVEYIILENTGEARTAYFKVYGIDDDANDVYSEIITVTQAAAPQAYTLTITPNDNAEIFVFYEQDQSSPIANSDDMLSNNNVLSSKDILISASVKEGYVLESVTVTDGNGDNISLNDVEGEEGTAWTFIMPESNVTISCTVKEDVPAEEFTFVKVTSTDDLVAGGEYIIVGNNPETYYAMSTTQNNNNRGAVEISVSENIATISSSDVQILTLEEDGEGWYFNTGDGYLYAASSSKNWLRTKANADDDATTTIEISPDGDATIAFQGNYTRNNLRFNNNDLIFSCYGEASEMPLVQLYKKVENVVEEEIITIGSAGYATYVTKNAVQFNDVNAYAVLAIGETSVALEPLTKAPANTPIIVEGTAGEHPCTIIESAEGPTVNCLSVSDGNVTGDGTTIYALANKEQGVGFYPVASTITIPAGKAYLEIPPTMSVKGFLALGGLTDAINNIAVETANGTIFNIAGQKVQNITKGGLYIVNGKKVFVK